MLTLFAIPFSHYCEKARWALDRARLAYRERPLVPGLHLAATRPRGGLTTPLLTGAGATLKDSTDILRWVDTQLPDERRLFSSPEAAALEDLFDERLGPGARAVAYHHLLPLGPARTLPMIGGGFRPLQRVIVRASGLVLEPLLRRRFTITDENVARLLVDVRAAFAEADRRLDENRYLAGPALSAADLTFAALAAPLLWPAEHPVQSPAPELPAALADLRDEFRATAAGRHALAMYREHRRQ